MFHAWTELAQVGTKVATRNVNISPSQDPVPHKFRTTTFLHPTWCNHCGSMIYGLRSQGKQCTECAINVHHRCHEMVPKTCGQQAKETRGRLEMSVRSEELDDDHYRLHIGSECVCACCACPSHSQTTSLPTQSSVLPTCPRWTPTVWPTPT